MSTTLTVATWNLQWKRPGSAAIGVMTERLAAVEPDIVCLTEAYATIALPGGYAIEAESDYGYPQVKGRRKVLLWSRNPWQDVDRVGHGDLPTGRFVRGRTETPLGPVIVTGLCIPWRDAHVSSGRRNRAPWQDHCAYLAGLTTILAAQEGRAIVVGDFNQCIPRRTAPRAVYAALEQALGARFAVATGGALAPLDRPSIDHIAHARELLASEVTALSNTGPGGRLLSDHFGVAAKLRAA
ncbi:MAG: endonuclease/exonuclease/phosphatase family protein [Novosphingobium sp.]|nr:endonuclease/exonuclease/phosphatase family protein [Novosphingobium sp.]